MPDLATLSLDDFKRYLSSKEDVPEGYLVAIGGAYLYYCWVSIGSDPFPEDEAVSRIGILFLVMTTGPDGTVQVSWQGLRLASSYDRHEFIPCVPGRPWSGQGSLIVENDLVIGAYQLGDGTGRRKIIEKVTPSNNLLEWRGEFETADGLRPRIWGEVRHVRWEHSEEFLMNLQGDLASDLPDIDPLYRLILTPQQVGNAARRIYALLPESEQADSEHPYVLIDVVSGARSKATRRNADDVYDKIVEEHPGAVVYRAEKDLLPSTRAVSTS
ncbi:MAG: hypothetical protein JSS66_17905 [Armatimonadetes bacterium]|nr:hypothetical protein [Armatimonadota bacterium]